MPAQAPLKIVRIIGRLNVGGPARQACLLHEQLRPEFQTVLISGRPDNGEEDMSYLLSSGEGVVWVDSMSRPVRIFSDLRSLLAIYRTLRREKPDIVHTHTAKAGTLGRIAAIVARIPVRIHTFHGHVFSGYFGNLKTRLYLTIERILARLTTRIVTVSEGQETELAETYRVASRSKFQVVRNGFEWKDSSRQREEIRAELGIKPDQIAVLWTGRMVPIKGIDLLADVVRSASPDISLHFLVAGDGPERSRLTHLIGGCNNVRILGWQRDVAPLLKASDVVLLTSINEGTPTSLIEAMFAARPFVATDAGGTSELALELKPLSAGIQQGTNGFIVDDRSESIIECLKILSNDASLRKSMGTHGHAFGLRGWSSTRLLAEMKSLYYDLANTSKGRAQAI